MMIDVRKCNAEGKYTGTLDFEFEGDASLIDIPFVSFSTPVHAVLDYEIFEDNSVEVKGELSFTLEGACSRCLKPTFPKAARRKKRTTPTGTASST